MKRDRDDNGNNFGGSKAQASFFQASINRVVQYRVQKNQRNIIIDFPDFIQHLLRTNALSDHQQFIPEALPEDHSICVIDSRKLVYPVQYGWDQRGRSFVCLKQNSDFNVSSVLILYRNSQDRWVYCTCASKCIVTPFEYDENNSRLGDFLTNPQVPYLEKVRALEQRFEDHQIRMPAPDF